MDPGIEVVKENPKASANIFSELTFAWMIKFFYKGVRKGIDVTDLTKTQEGDSSELIGDQLEANWNKQLKKAKANNTEPSLLMALANTFLWGYMVYGLLLFIQYALLRTFQPLVLGYLIRLFTGQHSPTNPETEMYITGTIMVVTSAVTVFFQHHTNFGQQCVGMRLRISVSTLVYRKMLRLSKKSLGDTAAGQVVNLLANDVARFDFVTMALHFLWISPFQVAIVTYFIWDQVGIAALAGIGGMVFLTLPLQAFMGRQTSKYRAQIAVRTDFRVRLMNEIISGIQVIKMYAWEKPFEFLVKKARINEVRKIRIANYLRGTFLASMVFIERTALYLTVITYVLTDNNITADQVFTMSQFFNLLQLAMAIFLPLAIQMGAETLVSLRRLQAFLVLDERAVNNIEKTTDKGISIEKVEASWTPETPTLRGLNLNIKPGQLCAIIGPVGAGKSSTLQLILGELEIQSGLVRVGGDISYSSQEPWLFGSTVRGNILFGLEYNKSLYQKVVRVCALEKDFEQFPQGDKTMVGERGVSLSGGQRARINLARAVYRNADIYIMDDPLSAVDTHVGKHLFEECIMNYLGSKTRILVTHQLQFLKKADIIVVINNGVIEAQGTFSELSKSDLDFTKMLVAADETADKADEEADAAANLKRRLGNRQDSVSSIASSTDNKEDDVIQRHDEEIVIPSKGASIQYIKAAGGVCILFILSMVLISSQVASSGADYWISYWTEQEERRFRSNMTQSENTFMYRFIGGIDSSVYVGYNYARSLFGTSSDKNDHSRTVWPTDDGFVDTYVAIYIYTGLIVSLITLTVFRSYLFFKCASTASKNLHAKMFNCLLKTPMRFFDINPSGRVLNRFSKDIGAIDEVLPRVLSEAIQIMLVIAGVLVLISIANYWMIIVIVVLIIIFVVLRGWFLVTAKSIKHVEGIAKSPVFSVLNSTLNGISTIRASNAQGLLVKEFDKHQDAHTSAWFLTIACMVSFGLWLDIICVVFIFFIVFSFILLNQTGDVSGAMVGLAISQSLTLTGMLQHGMRQTAEVVNQLTSVERVLQYTVLDQEGPFDSPEDKKPPKEWPNDGRIRFNNLSLKYSPEDPPVLRNLNINILKGEKVGIVGRTGAGKSSLISALFRLTPLEGNITVDDVNTQMIGLHDVRKKISIIPQEPVLFSAPIRYNLDPFDEYSDSDLWNALEEVELKEAIPSLDFKVDEGGANFSVGQRQLLCLARAIVRNNKILVLDEATANVDPRTDGLIQGTIRKKFKSCTVLTIAHRLNTIMDSDKVLVMDTGRMVEFDHPHHLLQNPEGYFTKMVAETGASMTAALREVSKKAYEAKLQHAALNEAITDASELTKM